MNDYSTLDQLAEAAAEKMITDGMDNISDKEFQLVMAHWMNSRAETGRREVIDAIHEGVIGTHSRMDAVKRNAPAAGGGFGLGVVVSFVRDFLAP